MDNVLVVARLETPSGLRDFRYRRGTSDEKVCEHIFKQHAYDLRRLHRYGEIDAALTVLKEAGKRPMIVDAGANIGASPVFFMMGHPRTRMVAIEPDAGNYDLLCLNAEGLDIRCVKGALAASAGRAEVRDYGGGFWALRTVRVDEASVGGVPCVTMNQIYEEECSDTVFPFIAKIDIEGFEKDVFAANTEWVDRTPVIIVELHDWMMPRALTSRPFLECMATKDRDFVLMGENVYSLRFDLQG